MRLRYIASLLVAPTAAAWIAAAPIALAADSSQACDTGSSDTECVTPGNAQINDSPPPVDYAQQYPYWEGSYGYGGGFNGGGMRGHR